jgi:hypothetical protein
LRLCCHEVQVNILKSKIFNRRITNLQSYESYNVDKNIFKAGIFVGISSDAYA